MNQSDQLPLPLPVPFILEDAIKDAQRRITEHINRAAGQHCRYMRREFERRRAIVMQDAAA